MKYLVFVMMFGIAANVCVAQDNLTFRGSNEHQGTSTARPFDNTSVKWKFQTGGVIRGTAVIKGQQLFFGSADGFLYAVDKSSGRQVWKFASGGAIPSCPAIDQNTIYFTSRDR